jgi:hypothetical protein
MTDTGADARVNRSRVGTPVLNWILAFSTLLGAAAVVIYAYLQVLGSAGCSAQTCPRLGPGELGYTLIIYGAPTVAVLTILVSFFTARRAHGVLLPIAAWILLLVAAVVLSVTFSH